MRQNDPATIREICRASGVGIRACRAALADLVRDGRVHVRSDLYRHQLVDAVVDRISQVYDTDKLCVPGRVNAEDDELRQRAGWAESLIVTP